MAPPHNSPSHRVAPMAAPALEGISEDNDAAEQMVLERGLAAIDNAVEQPEDWPLSSNIWEMSICTLSFILSNPPSPIILPEIQTTSLRSPSLDNLLRRASPDSEDHFILAKRPESAPPTYTELAVGTISRRSIESFKTEPDDYFTMTEQDQDTNFGELYLQRSRARAMPPGSSNYYPRYVAFPSDRGASHRQTSVDGQQSAGRVTMGQQPSLEYLQPRTYQRENVHPVATREVPADDPFLKYQSVAAGNPFAVPTYRDSFKEREMSFPSPPSSYYPGMGDDGASSRTAITRGRTDFNSLQSPTLLNHKRSFSEPRGRYPAGEATPVVVPQRSTSHRMPESARGDNGAGSNNDAATNRTPNKGKKRETDLHPAPLVVRPNPVAAANVVSPKANRLSFGSLLGRGDEGRGNPSYNLTVRDPETAQTIVRAPMKKLFGNGGMLSPGNQARSNQDRGEGPSRLTNIARKVKQGVENVFDALPNVDLLFRNAGVGNNSFAISIDFHGQAQFYMVLEFILNEEVNRFLLHEFQAGRITVASVQKFHLKWQNKGRAEITGFHYDVITQYEFVAANVEKLNFSGVNSCHRVKLFSVLKAWRVLVGEISVRTFCSGDSAIKKQCFEAERVLELIDATSARMRQFQDLRASTFASIHEREQAQRDRRAMNGVERVVML